MIPGGPVAAAFLLSVIPGWLFLRRTESNRKPRELTPLQEFLELVSVGLLTTGFATALGLLIYPNLLLEHDTPPKTGADVRLDVAILLALLLGALALAEGSARVLQLLSKAPSAEITVSVWWDVLRPELVPTGKLPWAIVALLDGTTIEGVLHNYTLNADAAHRDIALRSDIKITAGGTPKKVPYAYTLVPADQIKHVSIAYVDR